MNDIYTPSVDDINAIIDDMYQNISNISYDIVFGVATGGTVPANTISKLLNVPLQLIFFSSANGAGTHQHDNQYRNPPKQCSSILIIDDICDTGATLYELCSLYTTNGHTVTTGVLYTKANAMFKPTYRGIVIPADSPYVTFPWE